MKDIALSLYFLVIRELVSWWLVCWYLSIVDRIVHYININNFQLATYISFTHTVHTAIRCINIRKILYWKFWY